MNDDKKITIDGIGRGTDSLGNDAVIDWMSREFELDEWQCWTADAIRTYCKPEQKETASLFERLVAFEDELDDYLEGLSDKFDDHEIAGWIEMFRNRVGYNFDGLKDLIKRLSTPPNILKYTIPPFEEIMDQIARREGEGL